MTKSLVDPSAVVLQKLVERRKGGLSWHELWPELAWFASLTVRHHECQTSI
jgi:hypothetical protein